MTTADFVTLDVFTDTRFAGNPLAVFADARDIGDETMQRIAREFNYSEITFVLPPEDPANTARVRIFTPTMEIPFAGHPNVGTAFVLGRMGTLFGRPLGDTLRFEEKAGLVTIKLLRDQGIVTGAEIRAPRPLSIGDTVAAELVARCASIDAGSITAAAHAPVFVSVGLPFVVAELDGLDALAAAKPNVSAFHDAAERHRQAETDFSLFLYTRMPADPWHIRARMFAPLDTVMEDPATGSASAALGAYLATLAPGSDGEISMTIEQGVEMGRRSLIGLAVTKRAGTVTDVRISGQSVEVMRGSITC